MEETNVKAGAFTFNYAVITSLGMIIFSIILYLTDMQSTDYLPFVSYAILLAGIWVASTHFRDKKLGGFIDYGKAFKIGFLVSLFVALIMVIWTYVYVSYVDATIIEQGLEKAEEGMIEKGMSDSEIDQGMRLTEKFFFPIMMIWAFFGNVIIGTVISLVTSYFIKKDPAPQE